jgi:hypothetical protein
MASSSPSSLLAPFMQFDGDILVVSDLHAQVTLVIQIYSSSNYPNFFIPRMKRSEQLEICLYLNNGTLIPIQQTLLYHYRIEVSTKGIFRP